MNQASRRERILVFRIGQLGDILVSLPALRALRERFPDAHITLLSDRQAGGDDIAAAEVLRNTTLVDAFKRYQVPFSSSRLRRSIEMLSLLVWLRRGRFDRLVYLAPSERTAAQVARDRRFFAAAGIRRFAGLHFDPADAHSPEHEADFLLRRLARDGLLAPAARAASFDLQLGEDEERALRAWLAGQRSDAGRPWIAVGPGTNMPAKRWPVERYVEVVASLIAERDVWPVVFGSAEDAALGARLVEQWKRGYNAAGSLDVRASAAAMRRCLLYVGNDTGTMHLAAAAGAPCVALFSARDIPGRWHPYGPGHRILRSSIDCQGCRRVECGARKNECLTRISASQVLGECREMIQRLERNWRHQASQGERMRVSLV